MAENGSAPETLDFFGIVELLGHKKLAGHVTQVAIGSTAMLRIDVPDTQAHKGYTKYVGVGSVYAMTPVEEALMQRAAEGIERENSPIPVYIPVQRQLPRHEPIDDGLSDELHGHEDLDDESTPFDDDEDGVDDDAVDEALERSADDELARRAR